MSTEKVPSHLPIDDFDPEFDVLEEYAERFEGTVDVVTNTSNKEALYKKWFPLKLKPAARRIWNNVDKTKDWSVIKAQFKSLLVSPQQKYQWRAGHNRIRWDGRESFHSLASRVKTDVDIHQDGPREDDYYFNFRNSLPKDYQAAIDLGVKDETLEEAKRVAFRYQTASSTQAELGATAAKSVAFTGAAMGEERQKDMEKDRLKALELAMQGMTLQVENNAADMKKLMGLIEARGRNQSPHRQSPDRPANRGYEGGSRDGDYRNRDYRSPDRSRYDNWNRGNNGQYDNSRYDDRRTDDRRVDNPRYDDRRTDDRRYENRADDRRPQDSRNYNQQSQGNSYGNERGASGGYERGASGGYEQPSGRNQRYDDRRDNYNQGRNSPRQGSPGRFSPGRQGGNRDQGQRFSPRGNRGFSRERQPNQDRRDDRGNPQPNREGNDARAAEFESPIDFFCAALVNGMDREQLSSQVRQYVEKNSQPKN